jgi:hypothetical protein
VGSFFENKKHGTHIRIKINEGTILVYEKSSGPLLDLIMMSH